MIPLHAPEDRQALHRRLAEVERERDALRLRLGAREDGRPEAGGAPAGAPAESLTVASAQRADASVRDGEARLRALFDNAAVGIVEVDEDDRFVAVNGRLCELLRYPREQLLGKTVHEVTAPEDRDRSAELNADLHAGRSTRRAYEKRYLRSDGALVWVRVIVSVVRDPAAGYRAIATVEDIGARKAAEEERDRAERALRAANARLREADRRKDEFLGVLSHELRNPLAPIRTALYLLQRAEPGGPQARRAQEVATRQVEHLTRLVDDLLDVTRIARGKIALRRAPLDLVALARRTADDHRQLMEDRRLAFGVRVPPGEVPVDGDETRLAQVLGNLLQNAAKFTPPGGHVALEVRVEGPRAVVHVRDTGAGIEPGLQRSVFEPFTQAEQTLARSEGGLGLGLSLVHGIVTLHGGAVAVASEGRGRGSDFTVALPLCAAARAAEPPARAG